MRMNFLDFDTQSLAWETSSSGQCVSNCSLRANMRDSRSTRQREPRELLKWPSISHPMLLRQQPDQEERPSKNWLLSWMRSNCHSHKLQWQKLDQVFVKSFQFGFCSLGCSPKCQLILPCCQISASQNLLLWTQSLFSLISPWQEQMTLQDETEKSLCLLHPPPIICIVHVTDWKRWVLGAIPFD